MLMEWVFLLDTFCGDRQRYQNMQPMGTGDLTKSASGMPNVMRDLPLQSSILAGNFTLTIRSQMINRQGMSKTQCDFHYPRQRQKKVRHIKSLQHSGYLIEKNGIRGVYAGINDEHDETYSHVEKWGEYIQKTDELWQASVHLPVPDYFPSGTYKVSRIVMKDLAENKGSVYFTEGGNDELPATIEIQTTNPDMVLPVLDLNRITINAEPMHPEGPQW